MGCDEIDALWKEHQKLIAQAQAGKISWNVVTDAAKKLPPQCRTGWRKAGAEGEDIEKFLEDEAAKAKADAEAEAEDEAESEDAQAEIPVPEAPVTTAGGGGGKRLRLAKMVNSFAASLVPMNDHKLD